MFGSTMICWRSLLGDVMREEERSHFELMSHSLRDQDMFERRRGRFAATRWRAVRITPKTSTPMG